MHVWKLLVVTGAILLGMCPIGNGMRDASAAPVHLSVKAWVSPSSMPYDSYPTLKATTSKGAVCTANVVYTTGRSPVSFNGVAKKAGTSGIVGWSWHEETKGSGGTGFVTCRIGSQAHTATASFSVA